MGTKNVTITFGNQSKTYKLGDTFNNMVYRPNDKQRNSDGSVKNKLIFDFYGDCQSKTYKAANEQEFKHITGFLNIADVTKDGIIDSYDAIKLENSKNKPKYIDASTNMDSNEYICASSDETGGYIEIASF